MDFVDFALRVMAGLVTSFVVRVLAFLSSKVYRYLRNLIKGAQRHQMHRPFSPSRWQMDLEEILGDTIEKINRYKSATVRRSRKSALVFLISVWFDLCSAIMILVLRRKIKSIVGAQHQPKPKCISDEKDPPSLEL